MTPITYPRIPLKEMDAASLVFELSREVERVVVDPEQRAIVTSAAMLATHLHRHQTRSVRKNLPRVPYIEHPVRNALRMIRFGKTSFRQIVAALLHDTVEDCAKEIVAQIAKPGSLPSYLQLDTPAGRREGAHIWMADAFDAHIAGVVRLVTNREGMTREGYWMKQELLIAAALGTVPDPVAVDAVHTKAMDLLDNGGSLRHQLAAGEDLAIIRRRAEKYLPAVEMYSVAERQLGEDAIANALDEVAGHLRVILS